MRRKYTTLVRAYDFILLHIYRRSGFDCKILMIVNYAVFLEFAIKRIAKYNCNFECIVQYTVQGRLSQLLASQFGLPRLNYSIKTCFMVLYVYMYNVDAYACVELVCLYCSSGPVGITSHTPQLQEFKYNVPLHAISYMRLCSKGPWKIRDYAHSLSPSPFFSLLLSSPFLSLFSLLHTVRPGRTKAPSSRPVLSTSASFRETCRSFAFRMPNRDNWRRPTDR